MTTRLVDIEWIGVKRIDTNGFDSISWVRSHSSDWIDWIRLDWIGLDGFEWIGLGWIGLDWIGLEWIGLDWTRLVGMDQIIHD